METLEPWLGHVPRAALTCASVIARHDDPDADEPHQAHWLIIDEFNRAEIDKAIGALYTILGGGGPERAVYRCGSPTTMTADVVWLPHRFRIIATMNTVDTNYVFSFSQGLTRRFQFVHVGVPAKDQVSAELDQARTPRPHLVPRHLRRRSQRRPPISLIDRRPVLGARHHAAAGFFAAVRYDDPTTSRPAGR